MKRAKLNKKTKMTKDNTQIQGIVCLYVLAQEFINQGYDKDKVTQIRRDLIKKYKKGEIKI